MYEATWLKRAKGLVKKGRARFINETTLCIARPPYIMEDIMENINYESEDRSNGPRPVLAESKQEDVSEVKTNEELIALVLSKIDTITNQTSYLADAINGIREKDWCQLENDVATSAMDSIVAIVRHREDTNKSAIGILQKICDSLSAKESKKRIDPDIIGRLGIDLNEIIEHMPPGEQLKIVRELMGI